MTVPEPLTDELFDTDADAQGMDLDHTDLVAEAMCIYSIPWDEAEDRVLNQPTKTKAEIARFWRSE